MRGDITPLPSTFPRPIAQSSTGTILFDLDPDLPSDIFLSGFLIKVSGFFFFALLATRPPLQIIFFQIRRLDCLRKALHVFVLHVHNLLLACEEQSFNAGAGATEPVTSSFSLQPLCYNRVPLLAGHL